MATIQRTGRHIVSDLLRSPNMPTLLIISALVIGAAALIPLVQSSIATTTNGNVRLLEQQRDDWQAQIQELELDVATMAGLNRIENEARNGLKMVEPKETRYITVPEEAPEPRSVPGRYLPSTADEREAEPSAWRKLLNWLPLP